MKTYLYIFFLALSCSGYGQEFAIQKSQFGGAGSSAVVNAGTSSYYYIETIGQVSPIRTFSVPDYRLRQGFLQPVNGRLLDAGAAGPVDLRFWPNPVERTLNIDLTQLNPVSYSVSIVDGAGRSMSMGALPGAGISALDVSSMRAGLYFITVSGIDAFYTGKFIKR